MPWLGAADGDGMDRQATPARRCAPPTRKPPKEYARGKENKWPASARRETPEIIRMTRRVCVKNVGANVFSLVATLFWLYALQPGGNMLVSAARVVHAAPEQQVWTHRHNQTGII
jgi:hypothetical protein